MGPVSSRLRSLTAGLLLGALWPGLATAGPYFRLNPHPAELQVAGTLDTTRVGAAGGATFATSVRLAHLNERFSFYLGARGEFTVGPLVASGASGESYHAGGFLVGKTQFQVDSQQDIYPYVWAGPGWMAYDGHPPADGDGPGDGYGPALNVGSGVLLNFVDRFGMFAEADVTMVYPGAAFFGLNLGLQLNFGGAGKLNESRY